MVTMYSPLRLLLPACVAVLASFSAGCFTPATWEEASSPAARLDRLAGILVSADGRPQSALVRYVLHDETGTSSLPAQEMYAVVPLEVDGTASPPFAGAITGPDPYRLAEGVSLAQHEAIVRRGGSIPLLLGDEAKRALNSPRFRKAYLTLGRRSAFRPTTRPDVPDEYRTETFHQYAGEWRDSDLGVLIYARWGAWPLSGRRLPDEHLPATVHVLVLPDAVRRPPGAVDETRREAAALTPLTLVKDAGLGVMAVVQVPLVVLMLTGVIRGPN